MYNFMMYSNILYAVNTYNTIIPGESLTPYDSMLICLIKSFQDGGKQFFMSNKELARLFSSNESTIQRSINRLTKIGLLHSEKRYFGNMPRRYLSYDKDKLQWLLDLKY